MTAPSLSAEQLATFHTEDLDRVLGVLRLPPVGALEDADAPIDLEHRYELDAPLRALLKARRDETGLRQAGDLLALPGFGVPELQALVTRTGDLTRYGHRARPVWGGPEGKRALLDLLEAAQHSVHIQMYILGGDIGDELCRLLMRKAEEGVKVRLLFTASGFIISGGPSGTGLVSTLSGLRSWAYGDMYRRKRLIEALSRSKVEFVDSAPIGRHWRRSSMKALGITNEAQWLSWARGLGVPDAWIDEQLAIDEHCALGFTNVDHRKMILVDGCRAFIGSQNIADSYFYDNELSRDPAVNRQRWQWHDNSSVLEGGVVGKLQSLFAQRWILSGGTPFDWRAADVAPTPKRVGHAVVATQATMPGGLRMPMSKNGWRLGLSLLGADLRPVVEGQNAIRRRLLDFPALAENDLTVEHCYPSDSGLLTHWARTGGHLKDFTFVVPKHYDTVLLGLECDRFFGELQRAGMRLQGYDRAIMHSKILNLDGWYTSTGSYNLTLRSARADLELQFFVQDSAYGHAVRERIRGDLADCAPIRPTLVDKVRARFSIPIIDALVRYAFL